MSGATPEAAKAGSQHLTSWISTCREPEGTQSWISTCQEPHQRQPKLDPNISQAGFQHAGSQREPKAGFQHVRSHTRGSQSWIPTSHKLDFNMPGARGNPKLDFNMSGATPEAAKAGSQHLTSWISTC